MVTSGVFLLADEGRLQEMDAEAARTAAATRQALAAIRDQHDPALEAAVRSAWVKAYGLASWEDNRAFDEEGSDLLEILAIFLDIEDALGIAIPANIVAVEMTARDLLDAISRVTSDAATPQALDVARANVRYPLPPRSS